MREFVQTSVFFGMLLSLAAYGAGAWLKKKVRSSLISPLLVAVILTIAFLLLFRIDYAVYESGAKYISYFLTPVTVCLAVPLYEQFEVLRKNAKAICLGILAGVLMSLVSIFLLSLLFGLDRPMLVTLLPKSITTAIGMGVSEELGGYPSLTVAAIVITGNLGNILAPALCRLFRITDPVARGIAIGTASHAVGTSRAMEMGEVEGAMSGLSIVVAGVMTVVLAPIFANFL